MPREHGALVEVHRERSGLVEHAQQQLFSGRVLLRVSRVQVDEGALEVRRHFGKRAQLDQVEEVQVLEPPRSLALGLGRVEALSELVQVRTPDRRAPALVQQVFGAQVEVDAAVEAGDETIENTLLQTQACSASAHVKQHTSRYNELHTVLTTA